MFSFADIGSGYWWIIPVLMMILCVLMMRGRCGGLMCGRTGHGKDTRGSPTGGSARDVLDRRYAGGEIDKQEYEDKTKTLTD